MLRPARVALPVALVLSAAPAAAQDPFAGRKFQDLSDTLGEIDFTAAAADPTNGKLLYGAAAGVVYRSADGGRTWEIALGRQGVAAAAAGEERVAEVLRAREERAEDLLEAETERLREELEEEIAERLEDELGAEEAEIAARLEAERELERERARLADEARLRAERELPLDPSAARSPEPTALGFVRVHDLAAGAPGELLAATDGGLFRSSDGGLTLRQLAVGLVADRGVTAVDQDPAAPGRIYAGSRAGLSVSDGGLFAPVQGELGALAVNDVDVDDGSPARVLAATDRGLFVSGDRGVRFEEVPLLPLGAGQRVVAATWDLGTPGRAFAATADGALYVSEDEGAVFERLAPTGLRGTIRRLHAPAVAGATDPLLYVATDAGFFVSRDGGDAFDQLFDGLPSPDVRAVATPAGAPTAPLVGTALGLFLFGAEGQVLPPSVRKQLRELAAREPAAAEVVARTLAHLGLEAERTRSLAERARWSAAAPIVTAQLRRDHATTANEGVRGTGAFDYRLLSDGFDWSVLATWDAARLVFAADELAASAEVLRARRVREAVTDRVVRVYVARRRLLAEHLAAPRGDVRSAANRLLSVEEQTARLDGLTGGWFSEELRRRDAGKEDS